MVVNIYYLFLTLKLLKIRTLIRQELYYFTQERGRNNLLM